MLLRVLAPSHGWLGASASLSDRLVAELLERIISGEFVANSPLPPEEGLAELAQVGRSTVREAVKALTNLGVLEIRRGRGTFVCDPSSWSPFHPLVLDARSRSPQGKRQTTHKLLEARRLVEGGIAELAAQRSDARSDLALEAAINEMEQAGDDDDIERFARADLAFHQAVMHAADNPFIAALFDPLERLIAEERYATSRPKAARAHALCAHRAIFEAIVDRDPSAARAAMESHLDETARDIERHRSRSPEGT